MSKTETLSIDLLKLDGGTQARVSTNSDTVDDYAEMIENANGAWPFSSPVDVFHDGSEYFVADGFHRVLASLRMKRASVPCRVHRGNAKDAKIFGMTANDSHGLRMTRADKRSCVEWLLDHGGKMTQVEIAEKAGVVERTVKRIVADRKSEKGTMSPSDSKTRGKSTSKSKKKPVQKTEHVDWPDDETDDSVIETTEEQDVPCDSGTLKNTNSASIVQDALGKNVPDHFKEANQLGIRLLSIGRELDKYRQIAKELAVTPGGEFLRLQNIDEYVRNLKAQFQDARYYTLCPRCHGETGLQCNKCTGHGWLPEYLKGTI